MGMIAENNIENTNDYHNVDTIYEDAYEYEETIQPTAQVEYEDSYYDFAKNKKGNHCMDFFCVAMNKKKK